MIGHVIYNYEHLDDARIQQELDNFLYAPLFSGVHTVHAYNGKPSFGYTPYRENRLIKLKNRGHFQGAADLINADIMYFMRKRIKGLRYVLVTAADTWLLKPKFLKDLITEMEGEGKVLAASSWGKAKALEKPTGFSTDLFVIDIEWCRRSRLFPLDYPGFIKKFGDYFYLQYSQTFLEGCFMYNFQKYFANRYIDNDIWRHKNQAFRRLTEREPIHKGLGKRRFNWPTIGLYGSNDAKEKQLALRQCKVKAGPYTEKLRTAKDLLYFNRHP